LAAEAAWSLLTRSRDELTFTNLETLPSAFRALDLALTHVVYLEALLEYLERGGKSRGSFLASTRPDATARLQYDERLEFEVAKPGDFVSDRILEIRVDSKSSVHKQWVSVRPIPDSEGWFENVWRDYTHDRIVK
jgi:hypothetical protein